METILCLCCAVVVLLILFGIDYYRRKEAEKMTYDKLLDECKKLIDDGKYDKMKNFLLRHPKLLIQHFNELQVALTDYARYVESKENN